MLYAEDAGVVSKNTDGLAENDDHYRGGAPGVWADGVGEEDGDPVDAGEGETAGTATAATVHRTHSKSEKRLWPGRLDSVSYTHLTLPTILLV